MPFCELGIAADPLAALETAERLAGGVRDRWMNRGIATDEYADYVRAGRPKVWPLAEPASAPTSAPQPRT